MINSVMKKSDKALMYCWERLANKISLQMKKDSYDLWNLTRSVTWQKVKTWLVEVWSPLEYAVVREYWRQPWRFPPPDALVGWTARKWMISWWATQRYDDLYYKDKWVIFLIARAIARKWIKWKHTFQNTLDKNRKQLQNIYIEYMQQWL